MRHCDEFTIVTYYDVPQVWLERWVGYVYLCYWIDTNYTTYLALQLERGGYSREIKMFDIQQDGHFIVRDDKWERMHHIPDEWKINLKSIQKTEEDIALIQRADARRIYHIPPEILNFGTSTTIYNQYPTYFDDQTTKTT